MGKEKKAAAAEAETTKETKTERAEVPYEERVKYLSEIATPLAEKKLTRKLLKTIKKGARARSTPHFSVLTFRCCA